MSPEKRKDSPVPFLLNQALRAAGMSKRRLSKLTGIPLPMIVRLARGKANPTWATVMRIAVVLGCTAAAFQPGGEES